MKKKPLQKEIGQQKKRLRARIKEYINKNSIGVNVRKEVISEITDFVEDILIQYAEFLKENNSDRIYNETIKYASDRGSDGLEIKKIQRIENKSITLEQAVDVRHRIIRELISQNML